MLRNMWLIFLIVFSFSSSACLKQGDNLVLTGIIKKEIAYGPPGWGEDPKNDEKDEYWYLYPDKSLNCIVGAKDNAERNDKKLQMILSDSQYIKYEALLGKNVRIEGHIMFANSPYHTTPLLIYHLADVALAKEGDEK